jgi:hypothetical protein
MIQQIKKLPKNTVPVVLGDEEWFELTRDGIRRIKDINEWVMGNPSK